MTITALPTDAVVQATTVTPDMTELLVHSMRAKIDQGATEASALRDAIAMLTPTVSDKGAYLSSYRIADAAVVWRSASGSVPDPVETLHYMQHLLREAVHVCRHSCGDGRYRLHAESTCSDACTTKYATQRPVQDTRQMCPECFLAIPLAMDRCEFCP